MDNQPKPESFKCAEVVLDDFETCGNLNHCKVVLHNDESYVKKCSKGPLKAIRNGELQGDYVIYDLDFIVKDWLKNQNIKI